MKKIRDMLLFLLIVTAVTLLLFTSCGRGQESRTENLSGNQTAESDSEQFSSEPEKEEEKKPESNSEGEVKEEIKKRHHEEELVRFEATYPDDLENEKADLKTGEGSDKDYKVDTGDELSESSNMNIVTGTGFGGGNTEFDPALQEVIEQYNEKAAITADFRNEMNAFYQAAMQNLLVSDDSNTVCAPLNAWLAIAVLAESSGGETKEQLLDLLNIEDARELGDRVRLLMDSNNVHIRGLTSRLATSLWLSDYYRFNEDTLQKLADFFFISSFIGNPSSEKMNNALREWIAENVRVADLVSANPLLSERTAAAVVNTIYYHAEWVVQFKKDNNVSGIFHGTRGDRTVEMMHDTRRTIAYQTKAFTCIGWPLQHSGMMYFCLPKEGTDINDLLKNEEVYRIMSENNEERRTVSLYLPKFKVISDGDLCGFLSAEGASDVLDPMRADFSPLTEDEGVYVSSADQKAMIEIDEKGVTGAAVTMIEMVGSSGNEDILEVVLDRPFLFTVTGADDSILFGGVMRNIE